jgi:hypothetical protein
MGESTMTDKLNIHQRMAAAMQEVTYIRKDKKEGMKFTIVSHDVVTAKVRPVLLKNGIIYYPVRCEHSHNGNRAECSLTVRFVNIDEPSDFFDVPTFGYGIDPQDKGPGKAMSYAVKYALLKAMGLETGDDPDHDNIDHDPAPKPEEVIDRARGILRNAETLENLRAVFAGMPKEVRAALKDYATELSANLKPAPNGEDMQ